MANADTTEGPRLVQAVPGDVPAIEKLVIAAYEKWVPIIGRKPKTMTADYSKMVLEHRFDLAYVADVLAALVETYSTETYFVIENVAVDPLHQGQGLGRFLMAHGERLAASAGYSEVRLYTNKKMDVNIKLYESLGYASIFEEPLSVGSAVHMAKYI